MFGLKMRDDNMEDDEDEDVTGIHLSPRQMERDANVIENLEQQFNEINPFRQDNGQAINIANGDIATSEITADLMNARSVGVKKLASIRKQLTTSFHDPISNSNL